MNILQINLIYKEKSTGRTCYQLDEYFNQNGHQSITAYGWGKKYDNSYRINTYPEYYFHNIMSRITGLEGYFSLFATLRLLHFVDKQNIDVVVLHSLHGHYLHMPIFFNYLKKHRIKTIFHLHDCYMFTGKCTHYTSINCKKWLDVCSNCPAKKAYPKSLFFDMSKFLQKKKKEWFGDLNCLIIGNSYWTTNEAKKSFLKIYQSFTVYNWIDLETFKPRSEKSHLIDGLPNKFLILAVSAEWTVNSPRYQDLKKLSYLLDDNCHIVMVGKCEQLIDNSNVSLIEYIGDVLELSKIYSSVDCFVHFSIEDSFGKVIAEAQACGTPAIVYNSTACKEIVNSNVTGYVAEPRNVEQVFKYIELIRKNTKEYYKNNCREWAVKNFDKSTNCDKFLKIITGGFNE